MRRAALATLALALALFSPSGRGAPPDGMANDTEHRRLAELSGLWNVRQSLWLEPGRPAQIDTGTAVFTMVLAGRHLQQDLRVSSGVPFQALGYTGYDAATHTYFTTWMDLNFTGMMVLRGHYDAAARTYRYSGEMTGANGQPIPTRSELTRLDEDHFVVRYFEAPHGNEALMVELAYSRR